jgi:hypothetical protein
MPRCCGWNHVYWQSREPLAVRRMACVSQRRSQEGRSECGFWVDKPRSRTTTLPIKQGGKGKRTMRRILIAILSRLDEQKALTILGAIVSVVGVYFGFGLRGAGIEIAVFAAIAVALVLSRKT